MRVEQTPPRAADGTGHSAKTDPLHIIVESSLDAAAPGPVEVPGGLMDVPFRWGRWKVEILGGLIVVAGFAWTAMRFRRGRASEEGKGLDGGGEADALTGQG